MATVQLAARVNPFLKKAIEKYCKANGMIMSFFIQEALLDKLEELEDLEDIKKIRNEPSRKLSEVLRELGLNEKI